MITDDANLRKALNWAVDKTDILDACCLILVSVLSGEPRQIFNLLFAHS